MTSLEDQDNWLLMQKLSNNGQTNLSKWVKNIVEEFCEEKSIKECTLFNNINDRFDDDLHDIYMCNV